MILNRLNITNKQSARYFPKSPTCCNVLKWDSIGTYLTSPVFCLNFLILLFIVKYPQTELFFLLSEAGVLHCIFDMLT